MKPQVRSRGYLAHNRERAERISYVPARYNGKGVLIVSFRLLQRPRGEQFSREVWHKEHWVDNKGNRTRLDRMIAEQRSASAAWLG